MFTNATENPCDDFNADHDEFDENGQTIQSAASSDYDLTICFFAINILALILLDT